MIFAISWSRLFRNKCAVRQSGPSELFRRGQRYRTRSCCICSTRSCISAPDLACRDHRRDFSATFTTIACMGFSLSSGFRAAISLSCFLDRFLCSIWNPVSSPRPAVLQSRRAQELSRLAVALTFPRALPLPGHTLTALSTAAHSMRSG
jgi:hypothetical protein